jgi:hypothetical protein
MFTYRLPLGTGEAIDAVAIKLHHKDCSPWNRCAIIGAEDYIKCLTAGLPLRWGLQGAFEQPVAHFSIPNVAKPHGKHLKRPVLVARWLFGAPQGLYQRYLHSPMLLHPANFYLIKPRAKEGRLMMRDQTPEEILKLYLADQKQRYGHGHLALKPCDQYLVDPKKVDVNLFAFLSD